MNQFTINTKTVDPNDVSSLFLKMYPEAGMFGISVLSSDGDEMTFGTNVDVKQDELVKFIETNAAAEKSKREDKALETQCKVIKYKGNYYLVDGTTKIPLFDD